MTDEQLTRLDELELVVSQCQQRLNSFYVTMNDRDSIAILADLLTALDIAKSDIYWLKKHKDDPYYQESRRINL